MTTITLKALLEELLGMQGTFVLCNAHGSLEFKGHDLYLSAYEEWLTVYHATPKNPESQSHLHLKWHTFECAVITHQEQTSPKHPLRQCGNKLTVCYTAVLTWRVGQRWTKVGLQPTV